MGGKKLVAESEKEIGVLKINEQAKVSDDTKPQQKLFAPLIFPGINEVRERIIEYSCTHNKYYKRAACFVKEVEGENTNYESSRCIVIPEGEVQANEQEEKINKEPTIKEQRIFSIVKKLMQKSVYIKIG